MISRKRHTQFITTGLSLLLSLALVSYVIITSAHSFDHLFAEHNHSAEQCTTLAEQDPCHRRLIHNDFEDGCSHSSHLTDVHDHCRLCAVLHKQQHEFSSLQDCTPSKTLPAPSSFYWIGKSHPSHIALCQSRAPPMA